MPCDHTLYLHISCRVRLRICAGSGLCRSWHMSADPCVLFARLEILPVLSGCEVLTPTQSGQPLWSPQSTSTDEQCTALSSVISNVMYLLEGIHISAVQHRLSPFSRQKIVQTMSLKTNQPISQMLQKKPEEIERNLHWMDWKAIAPPSYKPKKSFQPRSIVNVCLGQVSRSQYRDSIDNDLCCWYNRHLRCAAQSVLMPSSSQSIEEGASLISLRTTNAIHEYLACLLQRVKKFPYKLSGFEDDDWAEKVENLSALRDQTSPTDDFSSDSD